MPKPYKGSWTWGLKVLRQRPHLAANLGYIASMWAVVETKLANIVSRALQADALVAISIYSLIRSEGTRLEVIESLLRNRLSEGDFEEYQRLKKRVRRVGDQRDRFMHAIWATSMSKPESIILIDSRSQMTLDASAAAMSATGESNSEQHSQLFDKHKASLLEYTQRDFIDLENLITELFAELCHFEDRLPPQKSGPEIQAQPPINAPPPMVGSTPASHPQSN